MKNLEIFQRQATDPIDGPSPAEIPAASLSTLRFVAAS